MTDYSRRKSQEEGISRRTPNWMFSIQCPVLDPGPCWKAVGVLCDPCCKYMVLPVNLGHLDTEWTRLTPSPAVGAQLLLANRNVFASTVFFPRWPSRGQGCRCTDGAWFCGFWSISFYGVVWKNNVRVKESVKIPSEVSHFTNCIYFGESVSD